MTRASTLRSDGRGSSCHTGRHMLCFTHAHEPWTMEHDQEHTRIWSAAVGLLFRAFLSPRQERFPEPSHGACDSMSNIVALILSLGKASHASNCGLFVRLPFSVRALCTTTPYYGLQLEDTLVESGPFFSGSLVLGGWGLLGPSGTFAEA